MVATKLKGVYTMKDKYFTINHNKEAYKKAKHLVGFIRLNHEILFEHPEIKPLTYAMAGWTELEPLRNEAMVWTKTALQRIFRRIPVPVKRLHTDNGSESLNAHRRGFVEKRGLKVVV